MNGGPVVLVIEDEPDICVVIRTLLERGGRTVVDAPTGRAGLRALFEHRPELVVLDVNLPDLDGFSVLERIRDATDVPVMILTARGLEVDKVRGLDGGADDYLTKPFGTAEFVSRVDALLRRAGGRNVVVTKYDDGVIAMDFGTRSASLRGQRIALTPTEYRLLRAFVSAPGQVLSTEQLLSQAWGDRSSGSPARVKHAIHRLREKLAAAGAEPDLIDAVRGFGYRYARPQERAESAPQPDAVAR